ncbi:histidine kinase-like protein [Murinocardiopsis flavida]|uniref:Histidine kinase-like protein n=1 Tax=Murinocardiopsis flavida TaxID=645275 RepID=A0A2P8DQ73_9ACTN|nr:histidine kinase-like protein [Murinocardiopsis flavida]
MSRAVLLPHAPSSVTEARQHLSSDLHSSGVLDAKVDDAALIVSELLSNALRHAAPLPPPFPAESVQISWRLVIEPRATDAGGWIEISVCDGGAETLPRIARPSLSALGGRGLGIVQCLAAKWGTEVDDDTTTVWAVVELPVEDLDLGGSVSSEPAAADDPARGAGAGTDRRMDVPTFL